MVKDGWFSSMRMDYAHRGTRTAREVIHLGYDVAIGSRAVLGGDLGRRKTYRSAGKDLQPVRECTAFTRSC